MYYTIHDFMYKDLGLKGVDLNVFALLYSFKKYKGSLGFICESVGVSSITTVQVSLKRLIEKGIIKKYKPSNKFLPCTYEVCHCVEQHPLRKQSSTRGEWKFSENDKTEIGADF